MTEPVRPCPICGSGNSAAMTRCWVCGASLSASAPSDGALRSVLPSSSDDSARALRAVGWLALLGGIFFVSALVGVELAFEWPGLLIPYALVNVVIFVALGRIAWVQLRKPTPPAATRSGPAVASGAGAPPKGGVTGADVMQGVALGLTIAAVVIGLAMLLMVGAAVLFLLVCFAIIGGAGALH